MALETKDKLKAKIRYRRGQLFSTTVITPAVDATFAWLFSGFEGRLDPSKLKTISENEKKQIRELFTKCQANPSSSPACATVKDALDVMDGNIRRKWAFGIEPHQFFRYGIFFTPALFALLWLGNKWLNPLYQTVLHPMYENFPYLSLDNKTLQQLENMDRRERYFLLSLPLIMAICMVLELSTDLKIPKMLFLMLLGGSTFSAAEFVNLNAPTTLSPDIFIENTHFDRLAHPTVFFKAPRTFTENTENRPMVELMLNGKLNPESKGLGFFARNKAEKNYDLKARLPNRQRAYFTKEVDQNETVYHLLPSKPNRP